MSDGGVNLELLGQLMVDMQGAMREMQSDMRIMKDDLGSVKNDLGSVKDDIREIKAEQRDIRTLVLAQVEQSRRLERRVGELDRRMGEMASDLEITIRSELLGRSHALDAKYGRRLDDLTDRVSALEQRGQPV